MEAQRREADAARIARDYCRCLDGGGGALPLEAARPALLETAAPSGFFRELLAQGKLQVHFPEVAACAGVPQNPLYHPEGDVFEHTMLVLDCAADLRGRAIHPLGFMLAALLHDVGKVVATAADGDGRITAYGHETLGLPLCERQLRRLTGDEALIGYVLNMTWLHMRPNLLAGCHSRKIKTRLLFDQSVCPEDLILLSRADASGKLDAPYDPANEAFLRERLEDFRRVTARPAVTEADLARAGVAPGEAMERLLARGRRLRLSGLDRPHALRQLLAEAAREPGGGR